MPGGYEPGDGDHTVPGTYASPAARRQEMESITAAAAPGGLARRPTSAPPPPSASSPSAGSGSAPAEPSLIAETAGGDGSSGGDAVGGGGGGGGRALVGLRDPSAASANVFGVDGVAALAPAADGWGLTGGVGGGQGHDQDAGGDGSREGVGGQGESGGRRAHRYFGLPSRDEWIFASDSRIEKLNSRAPWENSWTEEVRL